MSQKELSRIGVLEMLLQRKIKQKKAAELLNTSTKQIKRWKKRYKEEGEKGLIHRNQGKSSNRRVSDVVRSTIFGLLQTRYQGFGPQLASEKLEEDEILVSVEWLRQFMLEHKLWKGRKRKEAQVHQRRERRACFGELIQMDGSLHDWFEGRAPKCCLIVLIDDATSTIVGLRFVKVESTVAYFDALEEYIKIYGLPRAVYTDRHSIFRVNAKEAQSGDGYTQLSRALETLSIELICGNSPQAKGRVEKANGTLQDRLIKEMRLKNISTMEEGNAFAVEFLKKYNQKFAKKARSEVNVHREAPEQAFLEKTFSCRHTRKLSKNLELSYQNWIYQIQLKTPGYRMRNANVTILERKGKVTLWYQDRELKYRIFDKANRPAPIATSKEIENPAIIFRPKPSTDHPWKRRPSGFSKKGLLKSLLGEAASEQNQVQEEVCQA